VLLLKHLSDENTKLEPTPYSKTDLPPTCARLSSMAWLLQGSIPLSTSPSSNPEPTLGPAFLATAMPLLLSG
jgi:hypothetical protein